MKIRRFIALPFLLLLGSGSALAQSSVYSECSSHYSMVYLGSITMDYFRQHHPECFSGNGGVVGQDVIRGTTLWQNFAITNVVNNRFPDAGAPEQFVSRGVTGLSAGASPSKWSTWANYNGNNQRYTAYGPRTSRSESETGNLVVGADYLITPRFVLGASLAIDESEARSYPNATQVALGITLPLNIETHGYSIAPYLGWQITPEWTLDASAGWGKGRYLDNISYAKSDRRFAAINLSYTRWFGNWQALGKASYFHATEKYGDTTVNTVGVIAGSGYRNKLSQFRLGGQVGYWANGTMPYAGLAYTNDVSRSAQANTPWDRSALVMTLGVDFTSVKNGVTAGFAYNREMGRSDSRNYNFIGSLNIRF
ncbi:MAG: hypothetical protein BWY57_00460 [Betaproteobacteria bacterium ADurb.Bin341]|nr:MAG: hypothetical protein BWY57_00460 [Betaproteobacteria bacterium ADurb.Bin341]